MKLVVPGRPVPKKRPRLNGKTGRFYTPRDDGYENSIAYSVLGEDEFLSDVTLRVVFYMPDGRPTDIDNLLKAVMDGLQKGKALRNDAQVRRVGMELHIDPSNPRTEIELTPDDHIAMVYCHDRYVPVVREGDGSLTCSGCGAALDNWFVLPN